MQQTQLSSQAAKMSEILSRYTAAFLERDSDGQLISTHLISDLETQIDEEFPSTKFVKQICSFLPEHGICGFSFSFRSLNPHERISVKRAVGFIARSGLFHLQVMPAETDIHLHRVTQLFLRDYANRGVQIIKNLIHPHSGDPTAVQNFISWLGKQLAEEIASGIHFLRDAAIVDHFTAEESDFDEEILFAPQLFMKFDSKTDLLSTPLEITSSSPSFDAFPEQETPSEKIESINDLLMATLDFSQALLASVQSKFIEERLDGLSQDTLMEITDNVPAIIGEGISLQNFKIQFDSWIKERLHAAQDAREIRNMLNVAQVRVYSFLSTKWCSSYLVDSIKIIKDQNEKTIMNYLTKTYSQEGEGSFSMTPEILLRLAQTDIDSRLADRMTQEQIRFIKTVRSTVKSSIIDQDLLDEFLKFITPEAIRLANTGTPFNVKNNSSRFLNALDRFKKRSEVALKAIDAIRQSISDAAGRLNQLEPRDLTLEDTSGLKDYLLYWLGMPSGGSILSRVSMLFLLEARAETIVAEFNDKTGFAAIYAQESWEEPSISEKSLFGTLSRKLDKIKQM